MLVQEQNYFLSSKESKHLFNVFSALTATVAHLIFINHV